MSSDKHNTEDVLSLYRISLAQAVAGKSNKKGAIVSPRSDLDKGAQQQARTVLGSRLSTPINNTVTRLYSRYWPPVRPFTGLRAELRDLLATGDAERDTLLVSLRSTGDQYGRFLHENLAEIYAYLFSYRDGPCTKASDDALETALLGVKIRLEREFIDHWLGDLVVPEFVDQHKAADHLDVLAAINPGVDHPLFIYLREQASRDQLEAFLRGETIRNEVVDDEVALLTVGLQGPQKAVVAANLWDECGRGRLENFHTFWLRRFIEASKGGWKEFARLRDGNPWFAKITSNTNAMFLTRPAYKQLAYGCFLIFESWVESHFRHLLAAMDRHGITDQNIRIYFAAHVAVDPRHSRELSDAMRFQRPELSTNEVNDIVRGAHIAAEAGRRQYDRWLTHLAPL
jgi:hypothetical protein